jgi:hypothetical protein
MLRYVESVKKKVYIRNLTVSKMPKSAKVVMALAASSHTIRRALLIKVDAMAWCGKDTSMILNQFTV